MFIFTMVHFAFKHETYFDRTSKLKYTNILKFDDSK